MIVQYKVDGMTCGGCANSVKRAITAVVAEAKVEVDLAQGTVLVEANCDDQVIGQAVEDAGFQFAGRVPSE